ncbi:hypothetical protein RUM43_005012 [Polyplax serrata]|uniref:PDZ domain-containing protein n=1 Tax=Polyplax serrata TaxID=468196 RepID=A0AAN8SBL0_POLSC
MMVNNASLINYPDESERNSPKHKNNLCDNQILVNREVDNDTLEVVENGDLNTSNGELKEAMVPVVSTAIGLIATNSNFNRMPPDGHEFPQKYTEKPLLEKSPMTVKILNGSESEVSDSALPPLPSSEPPSSAHRYQSLVNGESDILSNRKYYGEVAATTKPPRNSFWRQDEKSEKSVRDKIAMFSSVPDSGTSPTNGSGKLSKYKSSDDVFNCDETDCSRNIQNGKHFSRSVITLDKVAGGSPYLKKSSYSDASVPPRSLDFSNRTQSSMDLTSSASSAYSSSCSPDSSLSSNSSYLGYSSTLPRKKTRSGTEEGKNDRDKKDASVHRTTSFSVHGRSQSLLDVNPTPYRSRYLSETSQEEGQKPGSLNLLIEQRRKNLSKLRGLVIPEKLSDSRSNQPIVDLPEIRSRDLILNAKMPTFQKEKTTTATAKWTRPIVPEVVGPKVTPTHLWDMQNKTPNIPKYSPAFKRKSISVFGAKEVVPLTTKKEISSLSLSDAPKAPLKPPRNAPTVRQNSVSDDKKYQDAVTSILCETEISYPLEKNHRMNEITRTTDVYSPKRKSVLQGKYRLHSDTGRSEEDSDNDSAVSSSRSSISHGFSPPASPLLDNQYQNDDSSIRNGVRLSPDRNPLARSLSMETSSNVGSHLQGNVGGLDANGNDPSNRRILKPQSVEAINRKNVLTSAKYSRGFDVKSGSPLIQRKFSEETVEDVNKHSSLPYRTTQQTMYSTRKYTTNGVEAPKDHHRQIEKIAYITDVVDAPIMSEVISKRKLEKSESVPLPPAIKPERAVTTRKASVPFEYSWGKEGTWNQGSNKSNEQVPVNSKESASLDKPTEKTVTSDREYGYSSLKLKVNRIPGENGVSLNGSIESRAIEKGEKPKVELKSTQNGSERLQNGTTQPVSVNDIRRAFEKPETSGQTTGKMTKTGSIATPPNFNSNGLNGNHIRVSSFDSTTSDDGPYGFSSNLLREQFGSITSLASSTSLISPQELQLLIEEANQTLEESGSLNGGSSSNNHDVLVIILHRDTVGGSIGITLAGGADYESKEITVHKVLAGSPADRDGRLQKGDRILSINGKSMKGVTHRESLAILKSPRLEVVLVVSRLKPDAGSDTNNSDDSTSVQVRNSFVTGSSRPSRIIKQSTLIESDESSNGDVARGPPVTLALVKDGAGLGFSLEGGKDCSTGDRPLLIKKIFTGGSAEKCGQLRAGDELVNINGIDVSVMSRIDAWKMMKQLPDGNVTITVKRAVENVRT